VKAIPIPLPLGCEMRGNSASHFLDDARNDNGHEAAGVHELGKISQVEVIGSEVMIGVEAHNGIKELAGYGQAMRFKDLLFSFGGANALPVVTGTDPQVGGPHLQVEFLSQKDGGESLPAAQVHHPCVRHKLHDLAE
jgi:hypothetical protein